MAAFLFGGIRENAKALKEAFSWNKGFKEYFAVKATPNPYLMNILKEEGIGADCSSLPELYLSNKIGLQGHEIMFSSNVTPRISAHLRAYISSCFALFFKVQPGKY